MKNRIILYMLLSSIPLVLNAEIVDFDGKSKTKVDLKDLLPGYLPDTPITPARINSDSSQSTLRVGVFSETGELVEVQPDKNWFNEEGVREDLYTFLPGIKIWNEVTCKWRSSKSWSAEVSYDYIHDLYGGHTHYTPLPPALYINRNYTNTPPDDAFAPAPSPIIIPETTDQVPYKFWIKLPEFATRINFRTQSYGSCANQQKSAVINVKYTYDGGKELQAMTTGQNYILYNSTMAASYHSDSHYGTKEFIDTLISIADGYRAACPKAKPLYINDMSLPWGGKFDLNRKWTTGSHKAHRTGINADVSKKLVRKSNRVKLIEIMCNKVAAKEVWSEGDGSDEQSHYHLGPKDNPKDLEDEADSDYKITKCCGTPVPEVCINLLNQGTTAYEPVTPSDCL